MNTTPFDSLFRTITTGFSRRSAVSALALSAIATVPAGGPLSIGDVSARKKKRKKRKKKKQQQDQTPPTVENVCAGKNWCVDRNQVCGPASGYGKCLVEFTGGNVCAEILFQAASCADCAAPNCTNCRCVLAAGGGDRCNNGATGHDFICVRAI